MVQHIIFDRYFKSSRSPRLLPTYRTISEKLYFSQTKQQAADVKQFHNI